MSTVVPCRVCGLPVAVKDGDKLLIRSKHSGARHENTLTLRDIVTLFGTAAVEKELKGANEGPQRDNPPA